MLMFFLRRFRIRFLEFRSRSIRLRIDKLRYRSDMLRERKECLMRWLDEDLGYVSSSET